MSLPSTPSNHFLHGPLGLVFAKTALPIIFIMGMNGLLTVIDAMMLGIYVGPEALGAVTLMFPAYMLVAALSTLLGSGMSSLLARQLGGRDFDGARDTFAGAHGLAFAVSAGLIILFTLFGKPMALMAAGGDAGLGTMGHAYLEVIVWGAPVFFLLAINADALRNEGRLALMAITSLCISLLNIGFNYVLIAVLDMGVVGSALGTIAAQGCALMSVVVFRLKGRTELPMGALLRHRLTSSWGPMLALGAPQSLNLLGVAVGSGAILTALQMHATGSFEVMVAAYGIITRVMTFIFLPLLGLSQALQSIVGNNYGAGALDRSDASLRLAVGVAGAYCLLMEAALVGFAGPIGHIFVPDRAVVAEVARVLPVMAICYILAGPMLMIATYFQAIGDAPRAALLGLAKPYLFALPLVFGLSGAFGEPGIWMATPVAELMLLALTTFTLMRMARRYRRRWGLFLARG